MGNWYKLHDSVTLLKPTELTEEIELERFFIHSGSRLLFTLWVKEISVGAKVKVLILNSYSEEVEYEQILDLEASETGHTHSVLTDFHKQFKVRIVPIGTVKCSVGLALHDNAIQSQSRIQNGAIDVSIVNDPTVRKETLLPYHEILSVPKGIISTIGSYVAKEEKNTYLQKIDVGGSNIAEFWIEINGEKITKKRTYFGAPLSAVFDYSEFSESGKYINEGDVVVAKVQHERLSAGDFEATFQILEVE